MNTRTACTHVCKRCTHTACIHTCANSAHRCTQRCAHTDTYTRRHPTRGRPPVHRRAHTLAHTAPRGRRLLSAPGLRGGPALRPRLPTVPFRRRRPCPGAARAMPGLWLATMLLPVTTLLPACHPQPATRGRSGSCRLRGSLSAPRPCPARDPASREGPASPLPATVRGTLSGSVTGTLQNPARLEGR